MDNKFRWNLFTRVKKSLGNGAGKHSYHMKYDDKILAETLFLQITYLSLHIHLEFKFENFILSLK